GEGAACDPASTTSVCANPLVCADAGGTSTCQPRSYEKTVVAADFVEACAGGIHVTLSLAALSPRDTAASMPIVIPFPFRFWGRGASQIIPTVNGLLAFAATASTTPTGLAVGNGYLPTDQAGPAIAPFWDNLRLDDPPSSDICYTVVGETPARRLVI